MDNTTIAQGQITYIFDGSLLPALPFSGDGSLVFPRPRQVTLAPYSNPLSNTFAKRDTEILASGGPIRSITINRDGSVMASNKAGTISVAAEKHAELVPFNQTPMPLAGVEVPKPKKEFSSKAKGWIATASLIGGALLLL